MTYIGETDHRAEDLSNGPDRYQRLFNSLPDAMVLAKSDGQILDCNSAAVELFGVPRQEMKKLFIADLVSGEAGNLVSEWVRKGAYDGSKIIKTSGKPNDGTVCSSEVRLQWIRTGGESLIIVHAHNIEEQMKGEQALRQKLAETESLFKVSQALISYDSLADLLQSLVNSVAAALPADRVILATFDLREKKVTHFLTGGPDADRITPITFDEMMMGLSGWVLRSLKPALSPKGKPDPREATRPRQWRKETESGSTIVVPLHYRNQVFGTLTAINCIDQNDFTLHDQELMVAMASQASMAVENARLLEEERLQREHAETLSEVAGILNNSLDRSQVLQLILEQLARVVEYDSASVMLLRDDTTFLVAHRKLRSDAQMMPPFQVSTLRHIQQVVSTGKPLVIADTTKDARWQPVNGAGYTRCWLGVPLIAKNRVIGLLNLDKEEAGYYQQNDTTLAMAFANQAAIAIENADLFKAAQRQAQEAEALRATLADISAELELSKLLKAILVRAAKLMNASGGNLGLYNDQSNEILIVSSHNMGRDYSGTRLALGEGIMGRVAQTLNTVVVDDYRDWPGKSEEYPEGPWQAVVGVPLMIGGRLLGVIGVVDSCLERKFSDSDIRLLHLFAQQAGIAVENARLYQSTKEAAERRAVLHRVSQEIVAASLDSEGIYRAIYQAASQLMVSEAFAITLVDERDGSIEAAFMIDRGKRERPARLEAGQGLSGYVLSTGESHYLADLLDMTGKDAEIELVHFGTAETVRSVLAVPMRLAGKIVGMLTCQSYKPNAYSAEDMYLLEMLSAYAATALENARLFQKVQHLAITDPLTDIYNRRYLFEIGQREFNRARRFNHPLAALMMDIDDFKQVNDTYGHATGDEVLILLSKRIQENVRDIDVFGRYGGEEFVIFLTETDLANAAQIAERLRPSISDEPILTFSGPVCITVSIGVAALEEDTENISTLLARADQRVYEAKQAGRNQVIAK